MIDLPIKELRGKFEQLFTTSHDGQRIQLMAKLVKRILEAIINENITPDKFNISITPDHQGKQLEDIRHGEHSTDHRVRCHCEHI